MLDNKDYLVGFAEGILVGGVIASVFTLLYAPKSGKKMRKDIRKKSSQVWDEAESRYESIHKEADKILADTEKRIKSMISDAESAIGDIKGKFSR